MKEIRVDEEVIVDGSCSTSICEQIQDLTFEDATVLSLSLNRCTFVAVGDGCNRNAQH